MRTSIVKKFVKAVDRAVAAYPTSPWRTYSSGKIDTGAAYAIYYEKHGDPTKVLQKQTITLRTPIQSDEVIVRMLAAPVNPSDLNMIQGTYGLSTDLPAVAGFEGVGQVIETGPGVNGVRPSDWVVADSAARWGTWRTHVVARAGELRRVPHDIPLVSAATLSVNPCTAYRLLHDFAALSPGDVVVQNCANSGVGQAVIQIADALHLTSVNIVRQRENFGEVERALRDLGAGHVVTDKFADTRDFRRLVREAGEPRLALNGAGGATALAMVRALAEGGTMVTYGGMSKQPVTVPTTALIFRDVRVVGFWRTRWARLHPPDHPENEAMWGKLVQWIKEGRLQPPPANLVPISRFEEAVKLAMKPKTDQKQVIFMEQYDTD